MANLSAMDLSTLISKHVFTSHNRDVGGHFRRYSPTAQTQSVLLRGRVKAVRGNELKLIMAGNGPEFDGLVKVVSRGELILRRNTFDEVAIEEEHGPLTSNCALGEWSQPY